ncbi:MAG: Crp/Fnr family transcriptional regulator [Desulfovibrionaceae bacterium]
MSQFPPLEETSATAEEKFKIQIMDLNKPWADVLHLGTRCCLPKYHSEPGEKVRGFYFIAKGRVRLTFLAEAGKEKYVLYMGKNCIFNEIPALGYGLVCTSFFCPEEVDAWRFDAALLSDTAFISQYPYLIANLLQSIAQKSGIFFSQLSKKTSSSSMNQLCHILLELYDNPHLCLSQSEVAALLGLHLTTVARLIRVLRDEGIVGRFTKTSLEVLDRDRLRYFSKNSSSYNE